MNYERPELRDLLAGRYVLGLLHGRARVRFERLMLASPSYRRAVVAWEERLAPLTRATAPVVPPRRVWRRIAHAVRTDRDGERRRFGLPPLALGGFVAAGVAAAAFFIVLGLYLARPAPTAAPSAVAVIAAAQGAPRWVITVRSGRMHMRAVGTVTPPSGKSYQLWMLPAHGAPPVSLGLLPASGEASEPLSTTMLQTLRSASGLAVSVEPEGGSPTGLPTGPVVYVAKIARV